VAQTDRSPRDGNNHPAILWIKPIDLQWHDVGTGQRTFGIDRGYRPNKITSDRLRVDFVVSGNGGELI
jgi:hypothetical protein